MSRLNLIVESLLKDIIEAQHAANCHAASLARQYGKRGRACGFPLPSAQIGSLEFDLKYAVTGTSGVEEKQVADTEQWSLFRQELEERVPAFAIRSIVMAVVHSSLPDDEARSDFSSLLAREEQWKKNFCSYLGKKISAAVSAHEGALLKAEPGLDRGLLLELLAGVAEREFMDNPELEDLFLGTRGDPLRQECRANLREGLSSFLASLAEKYVLTRQESSVVVDVEVEADKLKKMPEEAVQTLRLNISPASIPSVLAEQNDVSGLSAQ